MPEASKANVLEDTAMTSVAKKHKIFQLYKSDDIAHCYQNGRQSNEMCY